MSRMETSLVAPRSRTDVIRSAMESVDGLLRYDFGAPYLSKQERGMGRRLSI